MDGTKFLSLKIITLNIHSAINWHGRFDLNGLIAFLGEMDPDLIGLQEVCRFWSRQTKHQDIPGELGLRLKMFPASGISLERNSGSFGNLILSKYPICRMCYQTLPGDLEQRSFVFTELKISGRKVNFITTHLGLSESDRRKQLVCISNFINHLSGPLIVSGDFNGFANEPAIFWFCKNYWDLQDLGGLGNAGTFRSQAGLVESRMDFILTTPDFILSQLQVKDNYVSDHLPIYAEVMLPQRC